MADDDKATFNQRFPRSVIMGGEGPSMDAAYSGDPSKTEFALARSLREKAKKQPTTAKTRLKDM